MTEYNVNVEIESEVSKLYSKTNVIQKFTNPESNPLELKIYVYKNNDIIFSSFSAQIGNSIKVKSKVIKKEKAEEKYTDSISSGNAAIYVYEDKYANRIVINMGNIPPSQEIIFISEFIQLTETSKKTYEFELFRNLPIFMSDRHCFQNYNLKGEVQIKTKNKILKIEKNILLKNLEIIEEQNRNDENENNYIIKYKILELPKFRENYEYIPSSKIYFYIDEYSDDEPIIYSQKSLINNNEKSYIITYKNNQQNDKDNIKINPALFIFLIDQSWSMSGKSINIVSKALELFLQSLPAGSYYQFIGFGSDFIKYDEIPKKYTKENISNSLEKIKSLEANLGGTDIYSPLKDIYENEKIYNDIKLPKNIFLLTDGEIDDKKSTLEIIEKYSSKFFIFSIGIGNDFDKDLIKNCGIIGKGGFNFCSELEGLNSIIIKEVNKAIEPFITNFHISSSLDDNNLYKIYDCPEIVRESEIVKLGYITEDNTNENNKIKINIEYNRDKTINEKYELYPEEIRDGEELSKINIYNYLLKDTTSDEKKENLSLKYQILTEYTSLFAEVELSDKISDEMKSKIMEGNKIHITHHSNEFYGIRDISLCSPIKLCARNSNNSIRNHCKRMKPLKPISPMCYSKGNYDYMRPKPKLMCKSRRKNYFNFNFFNKFSFIGKCWKMCKKKKIKEIKSNLLFEEEQKNENTDIKIKNSYDLHSDDSPQHIKLDNRFDVNEEKTEKIEKIEKEDKNEVMKIINTQDFIDGFWELNEQTNYVKEKYEKEYELLKENSKINGNDKIVMTILVVYFIEKKCAELLNELSLVIKKAKIFVKKETKTDYEDIIKEI